ncbi:triphosphoribosyl-dephospho-CoA synthase [Gimesia algae]|uniref:Triphosphoribosyl-dephospho-CoA synthase n=1 Tax=Gimesia algae TaxID=2527971 RepID=A0A517VCH3_9PLAN|nr:triphosphoribosyl-dephospho-CoA synthase [Gimesia algae]QDT90702.1 triphosphoribosyl-dephospho-CoA synthase [Gimesia algae]
MSQNNHQLEHWCYLACVMEATARKPGNVHPEASFPDLSYADFLKSAAVIAPLLAQSIEQPTGELVLSCIRKTQNAVPSNSNLGMVLLLAPLTRIPASETIANRISPLLHALTVEDARAVYKAIRLANPGGMGTTEAEDIAQDPTETLRDVMCLAAERDSIAREYATDFQIVLNTGVPAITEYWNQTHCWETAIIRLQLRLMSDVPDTLIARKLGRAEAEEAARRARSVLQAEGGTGHLEEFDSWLREQGNQRNPGTTADLIVATLFVALRDGFIPAPAPGTIIEMIPPKFHQYLNSKF